MYSMQGLAISQSLSASSRTCVARVRQSRRTVRCLADTAGVEALLQRDRRSIPEPVAEWDDASESQAEGAPVADGQTVEALDELVVQVDSKGSPTSPDTKKPRLSKEAIAAGLEAYQASRFEEAIGFFNQALELPGAGAYRLSGTIHEMSCPSDGEEQAALYNMACAYAQLKQSEAALTCLEAVLESGFEDIAGLRTDRDLEPIRGVQFDSLVSKYDGLFAKVFRSKNK